VSFVPSVNFRLRQDELGLLDGLASWLNKNRTDTLRHLLLLGRDEYGLRPIEATDWLDELKANLGPDAVLEIALDDQFDPFVRVDGERREDLYVHGLAHEVVGNLVVLIYLADRPGSDLRILLGALHGAAATLRIPAGRLGTTMLASSSAGKDKGNKPPVNRLRRGIDAALNERDRRHP